ncbi:MAG: Ribonuclease HIII [Calditrichaeota bacterium]|nr:Ribonuclease HIII [Calditrichota bacterium]
MNETRDPVLAHLSERLRATLSAEGFEVETSPLQYGVRLAITDQNLPDDRGRPSSARGVLYHSVKKRRLSWVPEGRNDSALATLLAGRVRDLIGERERKQNRGRGAIGAVERGLACWVGTDEAGKGDLFGPLVAGGFVADAEIAGELLREGVRDSKELKRASVERLAETLRARWPDRCHVVIIPARRYNELHNSFRTRGGANGVLGWAHATLIREALAGPRPIDGAVVDRFGGEQRIRVHLEQLAVPLKTLILRPQGESNPAVAAGAILARDRFERALDAIGKRLGFRPHPGAGREAIADLRRLAADHRDELPEYVKTHFKPVRKIRDRPLFPQSERVCNDNRRK